MSAIPQQCVMDASVAIKLFLLEDYTTQVQEFFLHAGQDTVMHAPDLLPIECVNILWKQIWRNGYELAQAQRDLADLLTLKELQWYATNGLLPTALHIATTYHISTYDACYVALAEQLNLPLLTADNKLVSKLATSPFTLITLDSLFAPTNSN